MPKKTRPTRSGKKAPAKPSETQTQIAARLSDSMGFEVTRDMVRNWIKRGYDLHDVDSLTHSLRSQERSPLPKQSQPDPRGYPFREPDAGMTQEDIDANIRTLESLLIVAKDYETARTIKTQISGMREILRVQQERGVLMLVSDAESSGRQAGMASRQAWEKIEDELPPMLEGLTAAQMKAKLRDYARAQCIELAGLFADE